MIVRQGEIPEGFCIILEGHARSVYEADLKRKGIVSKYFRKSMRRDVPKSLSFG